MRDHGDNGMVVQKALKLDGKGKIGLMVGLSHRCNVYWYLHQEEREKEQDYSGKSCSACIIPLLNTLLGVVPRRYSI